MVYEDHIADPHLIGTESIVVHIEQIKLQG